MKKYWYIIPFVAIGLIACGGEATTDEGTEETTETAAMTGAETDLSEYGYDYMITLPDGKSTELEIFANDWGGLEITKGESFMMEMAFGEGDLELLKSDLQGDLVYKAEIIEESPDLLVYKREIPDSGMDPEYHFIYVHRNGGDVIEIQNMKAATFGEEAIKNMLMSAKSFKAKAGA